MCFHIVSNWYAYMHECRKARQFLVAKCHHCHQCHQCLAAFLTQNHHDTIHDQQLWYMINRLSWQWSMFIVHDQQSFIPMINVYLTWSTVFHSMIDVDHAWTVMNDIFHKAMNNANCIYTLTFTFLLSSSPTSGERRRGEGCSVSVALIFWIWAKIF